MLGMTSGASAQPATNDNVPRVDYIATMDLEHRVGALAYFDRIASSQINRDTIAIDQIDSDQDGVVTVVEMKAAGVIKQSLSPFGDSM